MTDLLQDTLFGPKLISTIGYDEQLMVRDILHLHAKGNEIELDPTYSIGNFYNKGLQKPKYIFDKFPQRDDVKQASSENLPLEKESISTIMFDPPFVIGGSTYSEAKEGSCIIGKRFMQFTSFDELKQMYSGSLSEFYRILKDDGIVIFKCQDCISSSTQYFSHCWLMFEAEKIGFYVKDLFILLAKNRISDGRIQQHARKFHSYYWVFEKRKNARPVHGRPPQDTAETGSTCV